LIREEASLSLGGMNVNMKSLVFMTNFCFKENDEMLAMVINYKSHLNKNFFFRFQSFKTAAKLKEAQITTCPSCIKIHRVLL
jgi:hypothetical protein